MTTTKTLTTALLALSLCLLPALASASDKGGGGEGGDRAERRAEEDERAQERMRVMRLAALTEALELDEATAAKLFPYLRDGDQVMRELGEQRREHRQALKRMVESGDEIKEKAVDEHIDALTEIELRRVQAQVDQIRGLKRILSPEQRIKYLVVRDRLENEIRKKMREARREQRERRIEGGR